MSHDAAHFYISHEPMTLGDLFLTEITTDVAARAIIRPLFDLDITDALEGFIAYMHNRFNPEARDAPRKPWPKRLGHTDYDKMNPATEHFLIRDHLHVRGGEDLHGDRSVEVYAPVIFGRGVRLRGGGRVIGPAIIRAAAKIGQGCRIKRTILGVNSEVAFATSLEDCLIGSRVFIDAGVQVSTKSPNPNDPCFGIAVGDDAWIGAGCIFTRGVIIPVGTRIPPGTVVSEPGVYYPR